MDIIFMYSENSKISDPCKISHPSLSDNINLKRRDKYVAVLNHICCFIVTWKNIKNIKTTNLK